MSLKKRRKKDLFRASFENEGRKEMVYLTMHSTHFIYGYMASGFENLQQLMTYCVISNCMFYPVKHDLINNWKDGLTLYIVQQILLQHSTKVYTKHFTYYVLTERTD